MTLHKGKNNASPAPLAESEASARETLETMIGYSGNEDMADISYDLALFKALNAEYADKPVVPAPRPMAASYTTNVGRRRGEMLERKIGIRGQRVLEIGCGAGMMSRVLAREFACEMVGVDISAYPDWRQPVEGKLTQLVHDVSRTDNTPLGTFDRVISFAVFEHIVHPHSALKAAYDMLKPGGRAYIYANLYRGAKASHRYREVFFPWAHLLFENAVWRQFYTELMGTPLEPAWTNKLTYDQYVAMAGRIGFDLKEHFPSAPFFDEAFYTRFETRLAAYPQYDLMHDFIHLVLEKPETGKVHTSGRTETVVPKTKISPLHGKTSPLLTVAPAKTGEDPKAFAKRFWAEVRHEQPEWLLHKAQWEMSRTGGATPLRDGVPWMTFAAINFLNRWLTKDFVAFEWGMGGSTVMLRARCKSVHSVEHDKGWFDRVADGFAEEHSRPANKLELFEPQPNEKPGAYASGAKGLGGMDLEQYVRRVELHGDESLDVVLVDGRARMACLAAAIPKIRPGGVILLDNANYPRYRKALDILFRQELTGWQVVDLSGPGPYSRTPAWQTLLLRRPGGNNDDLFARALPLANSLSLGTLRAKFAALPAIPFAAISFFWPVLKVEALENGMAGREFRYGWYDYRLPDDTIRSEADTERSKQLFVQSFTPLEPFLRAYSEQGDISLLTFAARHVVDWILNSFAIEETHRAPTKAATREAEDFVGYDTAIADRYVRLCYLVRACAGIAQISDAHYGLLIDALVRHSRLLEQDSVFSAHSNHGVFQALAQISGARYLEGADIEGDYLLRNTMACQGEARLSRVLEQQVGPDGVHKEHSPFYHRVITRALEEACRIGAIHNPAVLSRLGLMQDAARWLQDRTGNLANFGDTDLHASGEPSLPDTPYSAEATQMRLFDHGGYWIVRADNGGYLAQTAAFHSRVHKHADSGSLIWRDAGKDILIDSGRFAYLGLTARTDPAFRQGYWYSDPRRRYVESSRAHNTVTVDGQDHPRYRSSAFGSAFASVAEMGGVYVSEVRLPNLPQMTHARLLAYRPGKWLAVIDTLRSRDDVEHLACQHFNLHPGWKRAADRGEALSFRHESGTRLYATPLFETGAFTNVARGKGKPEKDDAETLSGWWSPAHMAFEPCTNFALAASASHITLGTLFTFSPAMLDVARTDFNTTRRRFRLRWRAGGKSEILVIDRPTEGGLKLS